MKTFHNFFKKLQVQAISQKRLPQTRKKPKFLFLIVFNFFFSLTSSSNPQLESIAARESEIAKELVQQKKKTLALLALKKKRYQEQLIEKTTGMLQNIEELVIWVGGLFFPL